MSNSLSVIMCLTYVVLWCKSYADTFLLTLAYWQ